MASRAERRRTRLSLRTKILAYLVLMHLALGGISVLVLLENRWLLLGMEVLFALSVVVGILLVRAFFVPLDLIRTGAELIGERDFSSTFREVGQPELDELVRVYNRMIGRLREERLRAQEQRHFLERVLEASPAGILTLDFDGRVAELNPAARKLLGPIASEAAGQPLAELGSVGQALDAIAAGASQVLPLQGSRRIKCSRAELYDRGFARSFFVLEELTDELRASEKSAYEKLIRMMSHEVNNTVGSVRSLLECFGPYAAQLEPEDAGDFTQATGVAAARLENLRSFMAGFAEMVRLPPPERRPCDLERLVDEIVLLFGPELRSRRIRCEWTATAEIGPIELDRNQIEQVLVNVLKNAIESIGEDGRIELRLELVDGRPELSIADTGAGIPPEARPMLFLPFFSTKRDGRGLGLTLSAEILRQHGYDFELGARPDRGAELRIRMRRGPGQE
jgi:two-component system, NtrC family, nitrogen regulation sensor histidine kinase NtrY